MIFTYSDESLDEHFSEYIRAFYFVSTTVTVIGYGEIRPSTTYEMLYVILIILFGITIFSFFRASVIKWSFRKTAEKLITQKKDDHVLFLNKIQKSRKDMDIPIEIYERCLENLDITYKYKLSNVFREYDFIYELKPGLVQNLIVNVMKNLYIKYKEFFWCDELGFQARDQFIMKLLISFEVQIFSPDYIIITRGEQLDYLYFVGKIYPLNVIFTNDFRKSTRVTSFSINFK
jgi:hypothetical protein